MKNLEKKIEKNILPSTASKMGALLKESICSQNEQIPSFKSSPCEKGRNIYGMSDFSLLQIFSLRTWNELYAYACVLSLADGVRVVW